MYNIGKPGKRKKDNDQSTGKNEFIITWNKKPYNFPAVQRKKRQKIDQHEVEIQHNGIAEKIIKIAVCNRFFYFHVCKYEQYVLFRFSNRTYNNNGAYIRLFYSARIDDNCQQTKKQLLTVT